MVLIIRFLILCITINCLSSCDNKNKEKVVLEDALYGETLIRSNKPRPPQDTLKKEWTKLEDGDSIQVIHMESNSSLDDYYPEYLLNSLEHMYKSEIDSSSEGQFERLEKSLISNYNLNIKIDGPKRIIVTQNSDTITLSSEQSYESKGYRLVHFFDEFNHALFQSEVLTDFMDSSTPEADYVCGYELVDLYTGKHTSLSGLPYFSPYNSLILSTGNRLPIDGVAGNTNHYIQLFQITKEGVVPVWEHELEGNGGHAKWLSDNSFVFYVSGTKDGRGYGEYKMGIIQP